VSTPQVIYKTFENDLWPVLWRGIESFSTAHMERHNRSCVLRRGSPIIWGDVSEVACFVEITNIWCVSVGVTSRYCRVVKSHKYIYTYR
jgi:hypothetical protein